MSFSFIQTCFISQKSYYILVSDLQWLIFIIVLAERCRSIRRFVFALLLLSICVFVSVFLAFPNYSCVFYSMLVTVVSPVNIGRVFIG